MILLHPYAQKLRNGLSNPKTYPYWPQLIALLDGEEPIIQVGVEEEEGLPLVEDFRRGMRLKAIESLLRECKYWIAVDSFLPHLAHHLPKPGVVLWGPSDPEIFGYPENLNLLKGREWLRKDQFAIWELQSPQPEAFLGPREVARQITDWWTTQPRSTVTYLHRSAQ